MATASRATKFRHAALAALLLAVTIELISYATGRYLASRSLLYVPPSLDGIDEYLAARDRELGWLATIDPADRGQVDAGGARFSPSHPEPGDACISLYGDSFVWSDGVDPEHAWGNLLSARLGCRVSNYGVSGYGSDQALMRFQGHLDDESDVVVLAHLTENVLRNLNQYRRLLYPSASYTLKPRFVLSDGELERVPMPFPDRTGLRALVADPERYLEHEYFLPGGPSGKRRLSFPYTLSVLSLFGHYQVRAVLAGRPRYAEFYEPDHASGAIEHTTAIFVEFERTARARGKRPLSMIISGRDSLAHFARTASWYHQPLLDSLREAGVDVFDVGPGMMEQSQGSTDRLFGVSHFGEQGTAAMAAVVEAELRARAMTPP